MNNSVITNRSIIMRNTYKELTWLILLGVLLFALPISLVFSPAKAAGIKTCADLDIETINVKARQYEKYITKHAKKYDVDRNFVKAIAGVESCYRHKVRSHAGAYGLMQLMPKTAKRFGVRNRANANQNIRGGVRYLQFLKQRFNGNHRKMAAAYNAGEGSVARHGGVPPFKETRDYVKRVLKLYRKLKKADQ